MKVGNCIRFACRILSDICEKGYNRVGGHGDEARAMAAEALIREECTRYLCTAVRSEMEKVTLYYTGYKDAG